MEYALAQTPSEAIYHLILSHHSPDTSRDFTVDMFIDTFQYNITFCTHSASVRASDLLRTQPAPPSASPTLSKRLERYVVDLVSHHKMVRTWLDGLDNVVERVEKSLEVIEQKVDEWEEEDEVRGSLAVQPAAAEGKGKGKAEEADDEESGDESEERTDDE